ncbi:MAG: hypothetical protein LBR37_02265 [Erysipelotrichaceae bacterium]|jgi:hypothetical protein|nr:hypothetical protein [Erysipelotrichaceae bacterium]
MLKNKKVFFTAILAVGTLLVGCTKDDIRTKPGDYNDPLLVNGDGTPLFDNDELYHNLKGIIYDSLDDAGTTKNLILNAIEETFSNSIYGDWKTVQAAATAGKDGIAFKDLKDKYSYYTAGIQDGDYSDAIKNDLSYTRLTNLIGTVNKRVNERLLQDVQSATYSERNRFAEDRFANEINNRLFDVVDPSTEEYPNVFYADVLITPLVNAENFETMNIIHKEYYADYIARDIVPGIYRDLLIENFIYGENYASLGRTYARKVNYIALTAKDSTILALDYLVKSFIETNILNESAANPADLEVLASAYRGYDFVGNAETLLETSGGFKPVSTNNVDLESTYYPGTAYGDIATDYEKITSNPNTTDTSIEASFTTENGNQIPKATGLGIKIDEMRKVDYTTDGWYLRNSGLSGLPEEITSRLFSVGVSNGVDNIDDEKATDVTDPQTSKYVRMINGKYYLTPKISEPNQPANLYWYETSSKTYYIVQIEEAVSSSKLSASHGSNYTSLVNDNGVKLEQVGREIALLLAKTGNYRNTALTHYFEQMNLQYFDQEFYDYMKTTFPELFEDK